MLTEIIDFLAQLLSPNGFPARWVCGKWTDFHGWLYISANFAVWAAYFAIPLTLFYFISKRKNVPFKRVFILFIAFILFCGLTHLLDALIFWYPVYRLNALMLFFTAIVSWGTVYALYQEIPHALKYKSPDELEKIIEEKTRELTLANQKLAKSEAQFKTLVNSNPDNIVKIGKDFRHTFVNDSIRNSAGLEPSFLIGKTPLELGYKAEDATLYMQKIQEVFQTKRTVSYDLDVNFPDATIGYYHASIVPLLGEDELNEVLVVSKNITKSKLAEQELKQNLHETQVLSKKLITKNGQLENFAHIVSHNLRAPVGNLNALLELYKDETEAEEREALVKHFGECVQTLNTTISDLTKVVNINQDTGIERARLSFEEVFEHAVNNISVQITNTDAEIMYDFSECPIIVYPKVYLESIMLNLLTNALKYRSPDRTPQIYFETRNNNGKVMLICQDNGLGIDMAQNGHKLFGLHKTFHRNPDARGVGLFITKNQIEAMGGSIYAHSQVNKGTTFTIIFNDKKYEQDD